MNQYVETREEAIDPVVRLAAVPRDIPRVDFLIVLPLLIWALAEAVLADGHGTTVERIAIACAYTLPLVYRRRWPVQITFLIAAVACLATLLPGPEETGAAPMPSLLVGAFSAALYARPAWTAFLVLPVPGIAMAVSHPIGPDPVGFVVLGFFIVGSWAAGWMLRQRAEQLARAHAVAPVLAREAVSGERARIARELHDVVAHSVSVISVQAGAAEQQLDRNPDQARAHLEFVRTSAHEALVELRRLVGILREDDAEYAPQPGLARLRDLVDGVRESGVDVVLNEHGDRGVLPAGVDLAAYRIVQEGLTNARRHAPGAAVDVDVTYAPDRISLAVVNGPAAGEPAREPLEEGDGHGLIGMRERVRLYGGEIETGPTPEGGFAVKASLPVETMPE